MPKRKSKIKRQNPKVRASRFKLGFNLKKYIPIFKNILGIAFILIGLLFIYKVPLVKNVHKNPEPIVASSKFDNSQQVSDVSRILIAKVGIDLPVKPAPIVGGYWQTSDTTASHGDGSANPGQKGNVVIFAHARQGLFYNLKDVKKGDVVYVFTNKSWYRYKVNEVKSVYPNDITVVAPTKKEVLTLFTCSGFFDEKRLIVRATPISS